jgi:hypothetical protein
MDNKKDEAELLSIQQGLDSVLDRLGQYLNTRKSKCTGIINDLQDHGIDLAGHFSNEEVAAIIHEYAYHRDITPLSDSIELESSIVNYLNERAFEWIKEDQFIETFGEDLGGLLSAIHSLTSAIIPERNYRYALQDMAAEFFQGSSKWIGESHGLPLVRNKKKDEVSKPPLVLGGYVNRNLTEKLKAVSIVHEKHLDGEALDDSLFDEVSSETGVKAGTIKAVYYSPAAAEKKLIAEFKQKIKWKKF